MDQLARHSRRAGGDGSRQTERLHCNKQNTQWDPVEQHRASEGSPNDDAFNRVQRSEVLVAEVNPAARPITIPEGAKALARL